MPQHGRGQIQRDDMGLWKALAELGQCIARAAAGIEQPADRPGR